MLSDYEIIDRVRAVKAGGMLGRLAACELAAHYRFTLGYSAIR